MLRRFAEFAILLLLLLSVVYVEAHVLNPSQADLADLSIENP